MLRIVLIFNKYLTIKNHSYFHNLVKKINHKNEYNSQKIKHFYHI